MADGTSDIQTSGPQYFKWNAADPAKSLQDFRTFVEEEAQKAINWYWRAKNTKKWPSQGVQFFALVLTAAAGLVPIVLQIAKGLGLKLPDGFDSGLIASLLVGFAAALLGLDKAFGYSSGWIRYTVTATTMTKMLQEFRVDWVALSASSSATLSSEQQAALIQRARDFVSAIQLSLLQETKDWAAEFQSNLAQMEKDVKSQLDSLKEQVDKFAKEKAETARTGAIELTVTNADKTDGFRFDVVVDTKTGRFADSVANSNVWTNISTRQGQCKVTINAVAKGTPVSISTILDVKADDTIKPSLTLPIT
jgi:hypothetical protein